jgi:hypothetical protein
MNPAKVNVVGGPICSNTRISTRLWVSEAPTGSWGQSVALRGFLSRAAVDVLGALLGTGEEKIPNRSDSDFRRGTADPGIASLGIDAITSTKAAQPLDITHSLTFAALSERGDITHLLPQKIRHSPWVKTNPGCSILDEILDCPLNMGFCNSTSRSSPSRKRIRL